MGDYAQEVLEMYEHAMQQRLHVQHSVHDPCEEHHLQMLYCSKVPTTH